MTKTQLLKWANDHSIPIDKNMQTNINSVKLYLTIRENKFKTSRSDFIRENKEEEEVKVITRQSKKLEEVKGETLEKYDQQSKHPKVMITEKQIEGYFKVRNEYDSTPNEIKSRARRRVIIEANVDKQRSMISTPKVVMVKIESTKIKNANIGYVDEALYIDCECLIPQPRPKSFKSCKSEDTCMHIRAALHRIYEIGSVGSTDHDNSWMKLSHKGAHLNANATVMAMFEAFPNIHKHIDASIRQSRFSPWIRMTKPTLADISRDHIFTTALEDYRDHRLSYIPVEKRMGLKIDVLRKRFKENDE
eukprot:Awhi_evm2s2593